MDLSLVSHSSSVPPSTSSIPIDDRGIVGERFEREKQEVLKRESAIQAALESDGIDIGKAGKMSLQKVLNITVKSPELGFIHGLFDKVQELICSDESGLFTTQVGTNSGGRNNSYFDMLPYDFNRLTCPHDNTIYANASHIVAADRRWILAQAPNNFNWQNFIAAIRSHYVRTVVVMDADPRVPYWNRMDSIGVTFDHYRNWVQSGHTAVNAFELALWIRDLSLKPKDALCPMVIQAGSGSGRAAIALIALSLCLQIKDQLDQGTPADKITLNPVQEWMRLEAQRHCSINLSDLAFVFDIVRNFCTINESEYQTKPVSFYHLTFQT